MGEKEIKVPEHFHMPPSLPGCTCRGVGSLRAAFYYPYLLFEHRKLKILSFQAFHLASETLLWPRGFKSLTSEWKTQSERVF